MRKTIILVTLLAVVVGGVSTVTAQTSDKISLGDLSRSFESLTREIGPAVVQILVSGYGPADRSDPTTSLLMRRRGSGSGVVLDPDGYIVTNAHVVATAQRIQVLLTELPEGVNEGRSILKPRGKLVGAQLVGLDHETDLAVLKVQEADLPALTVADSDELKQGELVFACGSPLGLENSVSMGIVSAVARQLRPDDPMVYIQTDATINPGNSGGPLVNTAGEVVGINTFIISQSGGSEGIGFAVPSNILNNVYDQIRRTGRVSRGVIGVNAQTITPLMADGLGLNVRSGVILGDVYPESPAEKAGLLPRDIVLTLNGKRMENGRQFDVNLYGYQVGDKVTLKVLRGVDTLVIQPVVMERADDPERFLAMVTPDRNLVERLGILGLDITDEIKELIPPMRRDYGVVVAARTAIGMIWSEGFVPGDVIHSVNGLLVENLTGLRGLIDKVGPGKPAVVEIERGGSLMLLTFALE